jgi:hypothetical protein
MTKSCSLELRTPASQVPAASISRPAAAGTVLLINPADGRKFRIGTEFLAELQSLGFLALISDDLFCGAGRLVINFSV